MFYVYVYLDPRRRGSFNYDLESSFLYEPFYVGKGKNKRLYEHLSEKKNSPKLQKIKKIISQGYNLKEYILILKEFESETEAFNYEIDCINKIGRKNLKNGPLTNLCEGGKGSDTISNHPNKNLIIQKLKQYKKGKNSKYGKTYKEIYGENEIQQKELRRIGSLGILKSKETKNKISNALKNKEPWNKGLTKEDERVKSYVNKRVHFKCFKSYSISFNNVSLNFDGAAEARNYVKNYNKTLKRIDKINFEKLVKNKEYKNFKLEINDKLIRK
jgi:hypothetical protein